MTLRRYISVFCLVFCFAPFKSKAQQNLNLEDILQTVKQMREQFLNLSTLPSQLHFEGLGNFPLTGNVRHLVPKGPEEVQAKFFLYTRETGDSPVPWQFGESIAEFAKHLLTEEKIRFVCHGYFGMSTSYWMQKMKRELLKRENSNVILIDWRKGAAGPTYLDSAGNIRMVARITATLLVGLMKANEKVTLKNAHFIGFSLGGQTGGFFGQDIIGMTGLKVGRITGLDPARPLFEDFNVYLNKNHADFVDIIHTTAGDKLIEGNVGMQIASGDIDFYPNGGFAQPGCSSSEDLICSHYQAPIFYMESINNCVFQSYRCLSIQPYKMRHCLSCQLSPCGYMGHDAVNATNARGSHFLVTPLSPPPYCSPLLRSTMVQANAGDNSPIFVTVFVVVVIVAAAVVAIYTVKKNVQKNRDRKFYEAL